MVLTGIIISNSAINLFKIHVYNLVCMYGFVCFICACMYTYTLILFYVIVGICKIIFLEVFIKQPCFMSPTSSVLTSFLYYLPQTPSYISLTGFLVAVF